MSTDDQAAADRGAEGYDGPTVDHSTPGEVPPFPADRPSTDALLGALRGLRYENDGRIDDTREALTAMVREGEAAGMYADDHGSAGFCTDHGQAALDVDAIRARAEDFREAIEASSDRVGVRAIKSARDVPALLAEVEWRDSQRIVANDTLHSVRAEVERLRVDRAADEQACARLRELLVEQRTRTVAAEATVARVDVLAASQWRSIPSDLPDATAEAYSRGRNDTLDAIRAALGATVTDTPTEGARGLRPLPRERYDAVLDSGPIPPAVGRKCGWCGGPHHDPDDCPVAQRVEAQRLCDAERRYEDKGGAR